MKNKKSLIFFLFLTIVLAGIVIYMGSRVSAESYGQSAKVLAWFTRLVPAFEKLPSERQMFFIRRMAHAIEYGAFALCSFLFFSRIFKKGRDLVCGLISMLTTAALACCDELLIQVNAAGRSGTIKDAYFDCACALVVVAAALIIRASKK